MTLKPCPFCGGEVRFAPMKPSSVWCPYCDTETAFPAPLNTRNIAAHETHTANAWNRRPNPRPSPVGREEVARWICRTVRIAQGFKGTAEYTLDDEVHNAWDDWLDEADDLLALFSPADGWRAKEGVSDAER